MMKILPYTRRVASEEPILDVAEHVNSPKSSFCKPIILSSIVVFHSSSGFGVSIISYLSLCNQVLIDVH